MAPITFEQFWSWYPRKVGKARARVAFANVRARLPDAERMKQALRTLEACCSAREFIPHPASWLNGGRWLDEWHPDAVRIAAAERASAK